jgi:hypothetical protein
MGMEHTLPSYARVEHQAKTLRDEFAMAALSSLITRFNGPMATPYDVAGNAYVLADAMLEERKITKGED